jgi:hypothetical protein
MVLKTPGPKDVMMDEEEERTEPMTPWIETNYNDVNDTPKEIGFA